MKTESRQKGYTLIETLAALGVEGILLGVLAVLLMQTLTVTKRDNTEVAALANVQAGALSIVRDVKRAATTTLASGSTASTLALDWTVWYDSNGNLIPNGQAHHVEYALVATKLRRTYDGNTQTVASFVSQVEFSRLTGQQENVIVVTITSSPDGKPQTAQRRSYHTYLQPKVSPVA